MGKYFTLGLETVSFVPWERYEFGTLYNDWLKKKNNSILPNIVIILICPGEEIPRFQLCNKKEEE